MLKNISLTFIVLAISCLSKCNSLTRRISLESRIFGGYNVSPREEFEFKWLVALYKRIDDSFFCAGSLISPQHVLTAAHCFQPKGELERLLPQELLCKIGRFNLSDPSEDGGIDSLVWDIVSNPDWNFNDKNFFADIAIVVLQDEIDFSNIYYSSVHLPPNSSEFETGTGIIAGWGKSNDSKNGQNDETPSILKIPLFNITQCMMKSPGLAEYLSYSALCGGYYEEPKGPCTGDSGGGLYVMNEESKQWEVLGIISMSLKHWIHGCDPYNFAYYTKVTYFGNWIARVMKETKAKAWTSLKFDCERTFNENKEEVVNCDSNEILNSARNLIMQVKDESVRGEQNLQIDFDRKSPQIIQGIGLAFPDLRSLSVRADHNFKSIERSDFASMSKLKRLSLYGNKVGFIAADALYDLVKLERLILENCGMRKFSSDLFSKLNRLTFLSLAGNSLRKISENAFEYLPNLYSLSLTKNRIGKLPKNLLLNNTKIEQFFCRDCGLEKIGIDFSVFPRMKEVFLEDNECIDEIFSYYHPDLKTINTIRALQEKIFSDC